ncbi:hypothetical protein ACWCP6_27625 [Streptomyces sp. NPDC002004]
MPLAEPVIDLPTNVRQRMVLSVDGRPRQNAHRVEVRLVRKGPDIASSDFDQDRPIVLNVGSDIITMIGSPQVEPSDAEVPNVTYAGSMLNVPKCLIKRGQQISVSLLVDGTPSLTRQQVLLRNVKPKRFTGEGPRLGKVEKTGIWVTFVALLYLVLFLLVEAFTPLDEEPWWSQIARPILGWLWGAYVILAVALSVGRGIGKAHSWYRRRPRKD